MVVFCGTFGCTGNRYVERKLLSLYSRGRRVLIQGSLCSPLKSGGFFGAFECTSKGYEERETSLASLERGGYLFRARFARLSKVVVFLALLNAPVESSKGLVGPRSLRSRGPIK